MGAGGAADSAGQARRHKRTVNLREVVNGLLYGLAPAANGAPSRKICARRYTIISICGVGAERSIASTTRFT